MLFSEMASSMTRLLTVHIWRDHARTGEMLGWAAIHWRLTVSSHLMTRRAVFGALALPALVGCSSPLPIVPAPPRDAGAARVLRESAESHGLRAYRDLTDINIAYEGEWRPLIGRVQPEVTDTGFRGSPQERLMPRLGVSGQAYAGPRGGQADAAGRHAHEDM
jgi:hypothetical protein